MSEQIPTGDQGMDGDGPGPIGQFWGKYRGLVIDNIDPLNMGRVLVQVNAVPFSADTWARPCTHYAGRSAAELPLGFFTIPPIGGHVWIEFEGGEPSYPIWSGCYWEEEGFPAPAEISPDDPAFVKMLQTEACRFVLNDQPADGYVALDIEDPAVEVPVNLKFDSLGVSLTCGPCTLKMNPEEGITIQMANSTITLTEEGITLSAPTITLNSEGTLDVSAGDAMSMESGADVSLDAGGALGLSSGGDASVQAGGAVAVESGGTGSVSAGASLSLDAGGDMSLSAPMININ